MPSSFDTYVPGGKDAVFVQDAVRRFADSVDSRFVRGRLIEGVEFSASETKNIAHGLGVSDVRAVALSTEAQPGDSGSPVPYVDKSASVDRSRFIPIHAERALTCDLWVY